MKWKCTWQNQYEDEVTTVGIAVVGVRHVKEGSVQEERDDYKMI